MEQTPILQQAIQAEEAGTSDHRPDTYMSSLILLTGLLNNVKLAMDDIGRNVGSIKKKLDAMDPK
jgi:CII-binding regulator of phage lambda lysogenization HflD